jgi:hypothetical protein
MSTIESTYLHLKMGIQRFWGGCVCTTQKFLEHTGKIGSPEQIWSDLENLEWHFCKGLMPEGLH